MKLGYLPGDLVNGHRWLWLCCCIVGLMSLGIAHADEITDDRGVAISFAQPPQRVISLLPSLTETVCELGACQRLVGVDRYSNYPASLQKLPKSAAGSIPTSKPLWRCAPTWCCWPCRRVRANGCRRWD
jgi:iron complex transport system substrate-binding protein